MWVLLKKPYKITKTPETTVVKQALTGFLFLISGCSGPLGMKSGKIRDYQITASSSYPESQPSKARESKMKEIILSALTGHIKFYPRNMCF